MNTHYHDTTDVGAELPRLEARARTQDQAVAALFRRYAPLSLSPSQAHKALCTRAPLTSIRRAITNLTRDGVLVKTDQKSTGPYGNVECRWVLKDAPAQGKLL